MNIVRVLPSLKRWHDHTHAVIDGGHVWHMPSIECPACQAVWGHISVIYPWIDPSSLADSGRYRGIQVCSPEDLKNWQQPLRHLLPPHVPLLHGAQLGTFQGKHVAGPLEDFYLYYGQRLVKRAVFARLRDEHNLNLEATQAEVIGRKKAAVDCVELHSIPRVRLSVGREPKPGAKYCEECGFDQRPMPEPLVVDSTSIPREEDLFQLLDDPGVILATERFSRAVATMGCTGIEFELVNVC